MKSYSQLSEISSAFETQPEHAQAMPSARIAGKQRLGIMISSTSYPIIGLAIWIGAARGLWALAAIVSAMAVATSFVGWDIHNAWAPGDESSAECYGSSFSGSELMSVAALGVRLVAVGMPLYSYSVVARVYGLPVPHTPLGWIITFSVIVSVAFAILRAES